MSRTSNKVGMIVLITIGVLIATAFIASFFVALPVFNVVNVIQ